MEYRLAPEVARIASELIAEHHKHLAPIRIEYVLGEKVPESGGKEIWGRARKITGLGAFFSADEQPENWSEEPDPFFVIEIAKPIWDKLEEPGRRALVDHELMHCGVNADKGTLQILPHYIEEFPQIIRRHGLWRGDVEVFARASAEQLTLDDAEGGDSATALRDDRVSQAASEAVERFREDHAEEVERGEVDAWVGSRQ